MRYQVTVEGQVFEVDLSGGGVLVDGEPVEVDLAQLEGTPVRSLRLDGASYALVARREGGGAWELHVRGRRVSAEVIDERTRTIREMAGVGAGPGGPKPIVAPMPGLVVKVEVSEGDQVQAGQGVVIVEAMKMENELRAQGPGLVTRVHVQEGEAVEKGQLLVDLEAPSEAAA